MQNKATDELFSEAKALHRELDIKQTLVNDYIDYQKKTIQSTKSTISLSKCFPTPTRVQKNFQRSFKQLDIHQKVSYYHMTIKHAKKIHQGKKPSSDSALFEAIEKPSQIYFKLMKSDDWQPAKAILRKGVLLLKIQQEYEISLKECLIRTSKDKKYPSIILLSLEQKNLEIRIKSEDEIFLKNLRKVWKISQYDRIKDLFEGELNKSKSLKYHSSFINHQMNQPEMIKPAKITNFQQFFSKNFLQSLQDPTNFEKHPSGFLIDEKTNRVRKTFYFPKNYSKNLIIQMITDRMHNKLRKNTLLSIKILKSLPQQQINFFFETLKVKNQVYEYYYAQYHTTIDDTVYIIEKSFDTLQFQYLHQRNAVIGEIKYCIWKVKTKNSGVQLLVQTDISYSQDIAEQKRLQAISEYIGKFEFSGKSEQELEKKFQDHLEYLTQDFEDEYLSEFSQNDYLTVFGSYGQHNNPELSENTFMKKMDDFPEKKKHNFLRVRHSEEALQKVEPNYFCCSKGHRYLGEDFVLDKQGYLKFLNEEKVKRQRAAIKQMIKKFGRSIFSGRGIINVSMPVQIFAKKSYLEFICELYKYAPRCLDAAANNPSPIERMKYVFCNKIASQALIKLDKPFNPILGQTYQATINGSLLFGQQISHHPPISATYFVGRNYKIHAISEPDFHFGLNCVYFNPSKGWFHVIFQKFNSVVRYDFSPIKMLGVIVGQRKCSLVDTSYMIDQQNQIFVKVFHGKTKDFSSSDAKFADFVHGKLVKLKPGTKTTELDQIKPSDYKEIYGEFHGRLSETLYFEKEPLLNFTSEYPYQLEDYQFCLDSNSSKREDLMYWKEDNIEMSEAAKIRMEEEQRRDRKLRSQMGKS